MRYNIKTILTLFFAVVATGVNFAADADQTSAYQKCLDNLFTDMSYSELKSGITAANIVNNDNYLNLPDVLKRMAMKVATADWSETNTYLGKEAKWDDRHARKYRVQLYEPYSEGNTAASMTGISAYTNMSNPTGIVGDKDEVIYVMVRDDIKEGASLYIREIPDVNYHNSVKDEAEVIDGVTIRGIKLNKGLNIITSKFDNSHFFIYYSVATTAVPSGGNRFRPVEKYKLSNYSPVKIHIEGGRVNGFFDYVGDPVKDNGTQLYTPDTWDDFEYTVTRATHPMYDLIGRYLILHFHLGDTGNSKGVRSSLLTNCSSGEGRVYDPARILQSWDKMCMSERIMMGIQSDDEIREFNQMYASQMLGDPDGSFYETIVGTGDSFTNGSATYKLDPGFHYNDYFNNKLMGVSQDRDGLFMSASAWRMAFHVNTVDEILTLFEHGDIWGPAHEYGHINQGPMNMAGTTEESNNIFSNVALYFVGKQTSRSDFISSQFKVFQRGENFLSHGTWGTTRMFWQLWCYYHATGHNKKFYPRLYELLRNNPIRKVARPGKHNELYDQLQFARMCCIAAEEDLTDFFKAWGFFEPFDYLHIGDYNEYDAYLLQEDIDAVKNEIASYRFPKNDAIILIDDRPGVTDRTSYSGFPIENAGEYGGLDAFREGLAPNGEFSFTVSLNTVTVETDGNPGAGYIIRDSEGNLLGFSNSSVFEVSDELADMLRTGVAGIEAVGADENHTSAHVVNSVIEGSADKKREILADILQTVAGALRFVDNTETKIGYISPSAAQGLQKIYDLAQEQLKADNPDPSLTELIDMLSKAYNDLMCDENGFIGISMGETYALYNTGRGPQCALTTDGTVCTVARTAGQTSVPDSQQWFLIPQTDGSYIMKNVASGLYVSSGGQLSNPFRVSDTEMISISLNPIRQKGENIGVFTISPPGNSIGMHLTAGLTITGWTTSASASQWTIQKIHGADAPDIADKLCQEYRGLLSAIILKYRQLVDQIDPHDMYVGYLKAEAAATIEKICGEIQSLIDDKTMTADQYMQKYNEHLALFDSSVDPFSQLHVQIEPGAAYILTNVFDGSRILSGTGSYLATSMASNMSFGTQWVFEKSETDGQFLIRNVESRNYIPSDGISYENSIPLKSEGAPFALLPITDKTGHFGLSARGDFSNSLVLNEDKIGISLTNMVNEKGQWKLRKIHEAGFMAMRDQFWEELEKGRNLIGEHMSEFEYEDWYVDFFMSIYNGSNIYNDANSSDDEISEALDELSGLNAYCEAFINGDEIITASVKRDFNDGKDNYEAETNRIAFSSSGSYTIENFLTLSADIDPEEIKIDLLPVNENDWHAAQSGDDSPEAYLDMFESMGVPDEIREQFAALGDNSVDGFWVKGKASARLIKSGSVADKYTYTLTIEVPCSGVYAVTISPAGEDKAFFEENKRLIGAVPVHIYPNLKRLFDSNSGFNIEGFDLDVQHHKVIIPGEYVIYNLSRLSQFKAYLPGTYFIDSFTVSSEPVSATYRTDDRNREIAKSSSKADNFYAIVDLSALNDTDNEALPEIPITVSVTKNGATARYNAVVTTTDDFLTGILLPTGEASDDDRYYDLSGNSIRCPEYGGIYILIRNGKAYKIIR